MERALLLEFGDGLLLLLLYYLAVPVVLADAFRAHLRDQQRVTALECREDVLRLVEMGLLVAAALRAAWGSQALPYALVGALLVDGLRDGRHGSYARGAFNWDRDGVI